MRVFLTLLLTFSGLFTHAQTQEKTVSFKAVYGNQALKDQSTIITQKGDKIILNKLKFYISNIAVNYTLNNFTTSATCSDKIFLFDLSKNANNCPITIPEEFSYENITFDLGIDSQTNVSGAYGGDLDPTNGMYWTWQSGYINFKLEGYANKSPTRKKEITFHLGGYLPNELALQSVNLPIRSTERIDITLDLKPLLDQLKFTKEYKLMSPGQRAIELSQIIAHSFSTQ